MQSAFDAERLQYRAFELTIIAPNCEEPLYNSKGVALKLQSQIELSSCQHTLPQQAIDPREGQSE